MGSLLKGLGSILGIGSSPKTSQASVKKVTADQTQANSARAALYATAGDATGQELNPDQVQKRDTLLGN